MGAIDLGRIDPAHWRVLVGETVYGPYTLGQLRTFAEAGRIAAQTKVAAGDGAPFVPAGDLAQLKPVFAGQASSAAPDPDAGNYLIVARQVVSCQDDELDGDVSLAGALNALGRFMELSLGVYILRTRKRLAMVHRELHQSVGGAYEIVIVDATSDRLAWLNLDADDNAVRNLWRSSSVE